MFHWGGAKQLSQAEKTKNTACDIIQLCGLWRSRESFQTIAYEIFQQGFPDSIFHECKTWFLLG